MSIYFMASYGLFLTKKKKSLRDNYAMLLVKDQFIVKHS